MRFLLLPQSSYLGGGPLGGGPRAGGPCGDPGGEGPVGGGPLHARDFCACGRGGAVLVRKKAGTSNRSFQFSSWVHIFLLWLPPLYFNTPLRPTSGAVYLGGGPLGGGPLGGGPLGGGPPAGGPCGAPGRGAGDPGGPDGGGPLHSFWETSERKESIHNPWT